VGVELKSGRRESITKIRALRPLGQPHGCAKPVPQPLGLTAASADDLKDLVATTFKSLIGEKPFCFLFAILLAVVAALNL
jgi:hypothetical protein